MIRRIENPYEYLDYRLILNDDFINRSFLNHHYSLRAYSRDLALSVSFLADILKGRKDLGPKKSRDVFLKLGFDLKELDYIENLIIYRTVKNPELKQNAFDMISRHFKKSHLKTNNDHVLMMKSVQHFIIHGISSCLSKEEEILQIAKKLGIENNQTMDILNEMILAGQLTKSADIYTALNIDINITNHPNLLKNHQDFAHLLNQYFQNQNKMNPPEDMGHCFVFNLNQITLPLFAEAYRKLIGTIPRLADQSETTTKIAFFTSSYITLPINQSLNNDLSFPNIPIDFNKHL